MHASILKYFATVARCGSIRKASEELHVATSALSRQIKKLEDELGTSLFERFSDGLRLTSAGEIALRHARDTLHRYDIMKGDLGDLRGKKTGRVHIACLDSLVVQFLPEQVLEFHHKHPAVDFRVQSNNDNIFERISEGEADVGITYDVNRPQDIKFLESVRMPLMAIVAPGHPLARHKIVSLQECAQFNMLLQLNNNVMSSMISVELSALERHGRNFVGTNNQMMLKPLVLSGEGIAFYTPLGFLKELEAGDVVAVPILGQRLQNLHVGVAISRSRKMSHASEAVAIFLSDGLKRFAARIDEVLGNRQSEI